MFVIDIQVMSTYEGAVTEYEGTAAAAMPIATNATNVAAILLIELVMHALLSDDVWARPRRMSTRATPPYVLIDHTRGPQRSVHTACPEAFMDHPARSPPQTPRWPK